MTGSRASQIALTFALFAACSTGGPRGDYGQLKQAATPSMSAYTDPITCPDMYSAGNGGFGDTCTSETMNPGAQATAATFNVISIDSSNAAQASGVLKQAGQTFRTNRAGHPGGVGVTLRLVTDTNLTTTDWDMIVDIVDMGHAADLKEYATPTLPSGNCDGTLSSIARGRYNTRLLDWGVDKQVRINFSTTSEVILLPERKYGFVFHMEPPGINSIGIAGNDQSADTYPQGNAISRQMRLLSIDPESGAACYSNPPFVSDTVRDMNFFLTLDDGCVVGATYSCSRGACFRTIPMCDTYGNFNQCHANYCTTDADCLLDWNHPDRGLLPNSHCDNPSGLDYQGTCKTQSDGTVFAEACNGVDDDCNGSTDDALGNTTCGTGACFTSVYSCDTYTDVDTGYVQGRPADCVSQEPAPGPESCNGKDDDCNNSTDDGLPNTAPCGSGPCRRSVYSCVLFPAAGWGSSATCTPDYSLSSTEICNGLDDNCDSTTDNVGTQLPNGSFDTSRLWQYYYPPPATANITLPNYYPPAFTQPVPPNPTTSQGQCHYGRQLCSAVAGSGVAAWSPDATNPWVTPTPEYYPSNSTYLCDGLDNDCDGYTDNVAGTNAAMFRAYWPSNIVLSSAAPPDGLSGGPYPQAIRNTGICQDGVETCAYVKGKPCSTDAECTLPQTCNAVTNVCDNARSPDASGVADARQWAVTTNPVFPRNETCNGLDDDCNGTTDDRSQLGQQICGQGVCQTVVDNCSFVTNMGWTLLGGNCQSGSYTNVGNTNLASTEVCNGLDDNCDGTVDNDNINGHPLAVTCHPLCDTYNAAHASSGTVCKYPLGNAQGICRYGLSYCQTVGGVPGYQTCGTFGAQPETGPVDETCNALDDDCDGATDNIANNSTAIKGMVNPACTAWGGLCRPNVGQCRSGTSACVAGALDNSGAASEIGPSTDRCNGFDDDCDAYTDNIPGTTTKLSTATWWTCSGATDPTAIAACNARLTTSQSAATLAVGQCHSGTNSCNTGAYASVTTTPVNASVEICNGLDDDCDINVDNKPGQLSYTLQQTCSSQCSVWSTNNPGELACKPGTGQCRNGTQTCTSSGWGGCPTSGGLAEIGPSTELCNAIDDNCDGYVDNAKGSTTLPLTTGDVCQNLCDAWTVGAGKASNCVPNAGICRKGTGTCNATMPGVPSWTGCFGEVGPTTETCNALDDDCDTYTDTVPGTPGTRLSTGSTWSCVGFGTATGFACKTYGSTASNTVTTSPTFGQCKAGTQACSGGSYSLSWGGATGPSSDVCNGFDDDCDGSTDNFMNTSTKLTTGTGWNCNGLPGCNASVATGACRFGTNTCAGAGGFSTVTQVPYNASLETCNGIDDDCDASTDNYAGSSTKLQTAAGWSCSSIPGCHAYGPTNSGTQTTSFAYGACHVGTTSCSAGGYNLPLVAPTNASTDTCNGIDDDCDGFTDNTGNQANVALKTSTFWSCAGFPGCTPANSGLLAFGQCRAGTNTCAGAGGYTTVNQSATGPSTETCDGSDNDCDGVADNFGGNGTTTKLTTGTFGALCWNGTYSCYGGSNLCKVGTNTCAGAGGYTTVTLGAVGPSTETCNGFDDECDGATDNAVPGNATKLATATTWDCTGFQPTSAGARCHIYSTTNSGTQTTATAYGQCRTGTNTCTGAAGYTTVSNGAIGPSYETCNGLDDDCTGANDDGVEVMNGSANLCAVQNLTPGAAGYQVNANAVVVNSVNPPCVSGVCGVATKRYDIATLATQVGWFGGCVSGYHDNNSSYTDGCECADDQFATTNTAPAGCTSATGDCNFTKTTVACEAGQDLCSVPNLSGNACVGGYMGGGANAVAGYNTTATAQGQIPNQVFRDFYYVKLANPSFLANRTKYSGVQYAPSEQISLNLSTSVIPSASNSQVFYMRAYPYGSYNDGYGAVRTNSIALGAGLTSVSANACANIMTQVVGNGLTQGMGVFAANDIFRGTAATFDLTHYTWNDSLCPSDGSGGTQSWCSVNTTWPNWMVIEVRRTNWAGNSVAPWEWVPGSSGHGANWGGGNQTAQSVTSCGILTDGSSCGSGAISAGASPAMPTNYYTLQLNYNVGSTP